MSGHNPGSDRCLWAVSSIFIVSPQNLQRTLFPLWISKLDFENQVSYYVLMLLDNRELLSQFRVSLAKMPSSCCDGRPVARAWLFPKAGFDLAWWHSKLCPHEHDFDPYLQVPMHSSVQSCWQVQLPSSLHWQSPHSLGKSMILLRYYHKYFINRYQLKK